MATQFKKNQFNFVGLGNKNNTFYLNKQEFPNYAYINPSPYFSYINTSNLSPMQSYNTLYQSLNHTRTTANDYIKLSGIIHLNKNNIIYEINFDLHPLIELWNIKTNLDMELTFDINKPRNKYQLIKEWKLNNKYKPQDINLLIDYKWRSILENEQFNTNIHLNYQITDTKINNPISSQGSNNYGRAILTYGIITRTAGRNTEKISDNPITVMKYTSNYSSVKILLSIPNISAGRNTERISDNPITPMSLTSYYQGYVILLKKDDIVVGN